MQTLSTDDELNPRLREWLSIRDEHIAQLEAGMAAAQQAHTLLQQRLEEATQHKASESEQLARLQKDLNAVRQEHISYVSAYQQRTAELQEEIQRWQSDYEQLRVQKGGFGFKAIAATGFAGTCLGLVAAWLFFATRDPHEKVFDHFKTATGFQLEYALRQRQFDKAEALLHEQQNLSANAPIQTEISWIKDLVHATKLGVEEAQLPHNGTETYALSPSIDTTPLNNQPQRTLVVTEPLAHIHAEALFDAPVLINVKKQDKILQWDRTPTTSKLKTKHKNVSGTAEDYWYEVENTEGVKGWVFGFYTNASLKRFKPDQVDTTKLNPVLVSKDTIKKTGQ